MQSARADAKARAKDEVEKLQRDPFTVLLTPLPDDIAITITDNGHGMSPDDVEKKFLPINRKSRLDANGTESNVRSESGLRDRKSKRLNSRHPRPSRMPPSARK